MLNIQHWDNLTLAQKPEDGLKVEPACHPQACAIQGENAASRWRCLKANSYEIAYKRTISRKNDAKSRRVPLQRRRFWSYHIDALYECCNLFYQRNGDEASVVSCPKANLLRLKMKQRAESVK
ncbi:hypothetical protein D0863_01566 [Hortaea werneckii]|uniref:Uncharacterized protein n=1 Tax=Hortaea werneckii TaxID=91943 RepID=A0A3M7EKI8_HORWE|nr:hypothetical protein D0863_01566 [Hortaea werneckii]